MINKALLLSVILASFALSSIALREASAQSPSAVPAPSAVPLEVIARNGADEEKHLFSEDGRVPMVMVRPNQTVPITLQFPSDKAGTLVAAMPLDGGSINRNDLVVLPTGGVIFTFTPSAAPGRYRLLVQTPSEQHVLEFYVVDPANPPFKASQAR
jgi:hypothetical protein